MTNIRCWSSNSVVEMDNNRVVVGGKNIIMIVNIEKKITEEIIENEILSNVFPLMIFSENIIICGCHCGMMFIYNIKQKQFNIFRSSHEGKIFGLLKTSKNQFISCSSDKTIRIFKTKEVIIK